MSALTYKKKDDIESGSLDKMTVFQDCISGFNASPIQSKKCHTLLAKLIHLLSTGETYPAAEATSLFFSITKLFQHKDPALRQMVYLAIKELSGIAEDVIMVTQSIMKDVQATNDLVYKPNAIRALVRIIDASIVQGTERLMKTAIVDRHAAISSAALVSSYHLIPIARDVVRRWANETQEAVVAQKIYPTATESRYSSGVSSMTQYHALGLLYHLRSHDRMALMKMIQQLSGSGSPIRTANAVVMLIRYIAKIIDDDPALTPQLFSYLESWLRHKSDIVNLEAAKTILLIKNISDQEQNSAIEVLRAFLASPRTVSRFSAIRILNRFAMIKPQAVVTCNIEIEALISDSSRSIATYAITTLLKTENEASVDRLMEQIAGFMSDITDEFKIIVVDAIRSLALKFPAKHTSMLTFLSGTLRDEGGLNFKTAVVEALFDMIRYIPESRDAALGHLCEFIEDCEFTELTVRVLHLVGTEGPKMANPTVYVRYIYNRVVLENAIIRAAAVTALAQFALVNDMQVKKSIKVLLTRCLNDVTDEVRDRAALSLRLLDLDNETAKDFIAPKAKYALPQLEHQLVLYVSGDKSQFSTPFDLSGVALITDEEALAEAFKQKSKAVEELKPEKASLQIPAENNLQKDLDAKKYEAALASIPEFKSYGPLLKSSATIPLTESETEYVVTAVKHIFKEHIVLQYDVNNTFTNYLEKVYCEVQTDLQEDFIIPIDKLDPESSGTCYVSFTRGEELVVGEIENTLKFITKEEPEEEGFDDDYALDVLELHAGDYVVPTYIGNFQHQWDELQNESTGTYQLASQNSIAEGTAAVIQHLSLLPLESSDIPTSDASHTIKLFGRSVNGEKVAAIVQMVYSTKNGVMLKISARSENEDLAVIVADSIGSI